MVEALLNDGDNLVKDAFNYMRVIVTAEWATYGYYDCYLMGRVVVALLNDVVNLVAFINNFAPVLANWSAAVKDAFIYMREIVTAEWVEV